MIKSTFSILFVVQKGKPKKNGRVPIMARITVNREMVHLSTRLDVLPERWISNEGRTVGLTKDDKAINATLDEYRAATIVRYNELFKLGEVITASKIKGLLSSNGERCTTILKLFDDFNAEYKLLIGKSTSQRTFDKYMLVRNRIAEFLKAKRKVNDLPITDITPKLIRDFDTYLRTTYSIANNHSMKMIQKFRTIYQTALDNGLVHTNPFSSFKLHFDKVNRGYLTKYELEAMMHKEMTSDRLSLVRDIFLFSCYTGLAYCDVVALTSDNLVKGDDGNLWISTRRQKTDNPVLVRLLDIPLEIMNRHANSKPNGKLFAIPSNQKVNDYLKEIAAICGINKSISYHLARHTFATTVTLSNGVPIETVSKMLGHSNIRTTQIYAQITQEKISKDMEVLATKLNGNVLTQSQKLVNQRNVCQI